MVEMERTNPNARDTDDYVTLQAELAKKLSESQRTSTQYEQSKSFIQKYGVRANVLGKMDRKLTLAGTAIDIKIADFDVTVKMLQKEYEFAKNAKEATESAKSAMMFVGYLNGRERHSTASTLSLQFGILTNCSSNERVG